MDAADPTTYSNNRSTDRTQAVLVAYKPIGITDYARFETNPDKRSDIANLGVVSELYSDGTTDGIVTPGVYDFPAAGNTAYQLYPITTIYGAPDAYLQQTSTGKLFPNPAAGSNQAAPTGYTFQSGGGSMHANMTARYYGQNIAYLYDAGANAPSYQDTIEIAGDLLLDGYQPTRKLDNSDVTATATPLVGQRSSLIVNPAAGAPVLADYTAPSNDNGSSGGFYSFNGLVRDGSSQNDNTGQPRGIARLEPPQMDGQDPASSLPRYKALAMNSPARPNLKNPDGTAYTPAAGDTPSKYGYGKFIYVPTRGRHPARKRVHRRRHQSDRRMAAPGLAQGGGPTKGNWNGHTFTTRPASPSRSARRSRRPGRPRPTASASCAGPGTSTGPARTGRATPDRPLWTSPTPIWTTTVRPPRRGRATPPTTTRSSTAEGNVRLQRSILSPNEGTTANPLIDPSAHHDCDQRDGLH